MHNHTKKTNNQDSSTKSPSTTIESKIDSKENTIKTESKKLDSNGDEIVWELKRNFSTRSKIYRIYFIVIGILVCSIVTNAVFWIAPPLNGFRGLLLILFWLAICCIFISGILKLFNFKRLYITDSYLVIEKYIGKK